MKKGLLVYKARTVYKNIGDYIQSVAAEQYTGRDVVYVEREHLHVYDGEPIALIMNGWYMHKPENWPPSKEITPLLTSIHMTPNIGERMLTEKGIEYLKKHGPVGCRDRGTERLLQSKGIPAYFSGCLTLTLGKTFQNSPGSQNIRFVDPYFNKSKTPANLLSCFATLMSNFKVISNISLKLNKSASIKSLLKAASFYRAYSQTFEDEVLLKADYLTHSILEASLGDEAAKFDYTRDLLQKYADSKFIVTSRIHVTLPCIGMNTPVIFVISDHYKKKPTSKGRFDGIIELFNVMEYSDTALTPVMGFALDGRVGVNTVVRNKQNHLKITEELDRSCKAFINSVG